MNADRQLGGEGQVNRQARLFLNAWTIFLFLVGFATIALVADWLGVGEVPRE